MTIPSMEKSTKTSRDLLRRCRLVYRRTSTSATNAVSTEELQNLKQITANWCKSQVLFVDDVWRRLAPWTSLLEPVFALKKFHASSSYIQNTLSNEWVMNLAVFPSWFFYRWFLSLLYCLYTSLVLP